MSADELYRDDVRGALQAAGWHEDSRGHVVAPNGALWVETNDALDSGIDSPDKSWGVSFSSDVPAVVIVAACLAAAGEDAASTPHGFEREHQGESDAKRRLARCKRCGQDRFASAHKAEEATS